MSKLVAVHSYRGGTGKSNLSANLAACLAARGKRVGVIDTDLQSPGVSVLFGRARQTGPLLNEYLWGQCTLCQVAVDATDALGASANGGTIFLVAASMELGKITRVLKEGYDVGLLNAGFKELSAGKQLDYLIVDTHPGLNEETLLSLAVADLSLVVLRPDQQDYLGTSITVEVARKLDVRDLRLMVNMLPDTFDEKQVRDKVTSTYGCPVAQVFGNYLELRTLASAGLLSVTAPQSQFSVRMRALAEQVA